MKIVQLTPEQFDEFSKNHILHSYYQTSAYGNIMKKNKYMIEYLGFIENDELIGASLVLYNNLFLGFKYAYAPRGILIDYTNKDVLSKVTNQLYWHLKMKNVAFFKIDPPVMDTKRNKEGKIAGIAKISSKQNLIKCGFTPFGDTLYFETFEPRWNAIINLKDNVDDVIPLFNKSVRNKVKKAISRGIQIEKLLPENIGRSYKFVPRKKGRTISYYNDFQLFFGNNFEIYIAKLDTEKYLKAIKVLYEKEQALNDDIANQIRSRKIKGMDMRKIINKKMESDKRFATYDKELKNATIFLSRFTEGIDIGTISLVKTPTTIYILIEGFDNRFKILYPNYLLKWHVIDKYSKIGYKNFDLNAITGNFTKENKYKGLNDAKLGYGSEVCEYIGEFDLIISKFIFSIFKKIGGELWLKRRRND